MGENLCPHCGSDAVVSVPENDKNTRKFALCGDCEATGPTVTGSQRKAIAAFCRPAHIVEEYEAKIARMQRVLDEYQFAAAELAGTNSAVDDHGLARLLLKHRQLAQNLQRKHIEEATHEHDR